MRPQVIIWATLGLNAALFGVNLAIAVISGSRAVLSQAIYTITDLVGGIVLMWGYSVSQRPPDVDHPFGHGKERFFWAFTASLITFSTAGLLTLVSGIQQILAPTPVTHLPAALASVAATLGTSVVGIGVTLRELRSGQESLQSFLESAHQGLKTVFYQDVVSVFGSAVALAGLAALYVTGDDVIDGVAASAVGAILVATGFVVAAETREFLVGKAISRSSARLVIGVVERDPRVRKVRGFQSMLLGPDDALVALKVNFQDGLTTDQIESAIDQVSLELRMAFPALRHLIIEPES
ncbi:MAG TPA: cation diffusion facilitator family transporter [Thermoplasmata archaeon]|nr:cation diffusion facilitator family transporter [Thermoplasmata archaeon]